MQLQVIGKIVFTAELFDEVVVICHGLNVFFRHPAFKLGSALSVKDKTDGDILLIVDPLKCIKAVSTHLLDLTLNGTYPLGIGKRIFTVVLIYRFGSHPVLSNVWIVRTLCFLLGSIVGPVYRKLHIGLS